MQQARSTLTSSCRAQITGNDMWGHHLSFNSKLDVLVKRREAFASFQLVNSFHLINAQTGCAVKGGGPQRGVASARATQDSIASVPGGDSSTDGGTKDSGKISALRNRYSSVGMSWSGTDHTLSAVAGLRL